MSKYLENLNFAQREAVINTEGASLVIAGAGSGKTRVLTYRIAHLLEKGVSPSSILALTFTNKAAREMKERIAAEVGNSVSRYLWMGTFHSIFSRILRTEHEVIDYPSTFTIYDTQDSRSLLKSVIKGMSLDENTYKPGVILNKISEAKNNLITPAAYLQDARLRENDRHSRMPFTGEIYRDYALRCKNAGAMDFDDLLLITNILFQRFPDILGKYQHIFKYILVDEYQDTNYSQYLIIKRLAELHKNICVVGDDAQSIYSFRGARIENILNFKDDYQGFKTYKLEQNYRSTQVIVDAANSLIAKNKNQIHKTVFSENSIGDRIKVLTAMNEQEEGFLVSNEIFDFRMREHDDFADFAILYRTNAQSRVFEEVLRKRNIPYKIYGGLSFYQRKEIKDILSYFRLIINPKDDESFKRIINYPARGIGDTTLNKIENAAVASGNSMWDIAVSPQKLSENGINAGTIKKISEFTKLIEKFTDVFLTTEAYEMANKIASESGLLTELYRDKAPENVSRYENTQELLNAIQDFSINAREEGRPAGLQIFMEDVALLTDQDNDKETNADKVTMMTVHSSKGLEFKNVFIVGLEENLFPSGFSGTLSLPELEEERRLFYVALTRSKKQAWLSCAQQRMRWGKTEFSNPSRFIGEIDHQYLDIQNSRAFPQFRNREIVAEINNRKFQNEESAYRPPKRSDTPINRISPNRIPVRENSKPFEGDSPDLIKAGIYVEHERFGRGKVLQLEGKMPDLKAKVLFPNAGEKNLLLKFAKLKISDQQV